MVKVPPWNKIIIQWKYTNKCLPVYGLVYTNNCLLVKQIVREYKQYTTDVTKDTSSFYFYSVIFGCCFGHFDNTYSKKIGSDTICFGGKIHGTDLTYITLEKEKDLCNEK
jgi:hypothetical protein